MHGVIKKMFILYDIDLGKMKRNIRGLHCLQIDLRNHTVSINGSAESVDEAILEINNVIDDLRNTQNCDHVENEEHQCSICFMEIDDGKIYRLEACGHPFCKTCIVPQLESAVGNNDFPITCCKEDCGESFGTFNMVTTTGLFYWQTAVWTRFTIVGVLFQPDLYPGRIFFQFFHHVA
jgi:ATP-dependent RNA helicase DHX8/PRP22